MRNDVDVSTFDYEGLNSLKVTFYLPGQEAVFGTLLSICNPARGGGRGTCQTQVVWLSRNNRAYTH